MSFSTGFTNRNANPCQAWIQLSKIKDEAGNKSELPVFVRWDKEKKQNVVCDLTKGFIVLDPDLIKIDGYNRKIQRNVMSNEVRTVHDELTVISYLADNSKKQWFKGSYMEFKDSNLMEGVGAKYANSIYIAISPEQVGLEVDAPLVIGNITSSGACCDAWMTFCSKIRPSVFQKQMVVHDNNLWTPKTNGDVHYHVPTFSLGAEITKELAGACIDLDITLQEYLKEYLKTGAVPNHDTETTHDTTTNQGQAEDAPDQSQDFDEDGKPMALQWVLKDTSTLGDHSIESLEEMAKYLKENNIDPKKNKTCANVHVVLKYRKDEAAKAAAKAEAKPSIASFLKTSEDDDDIPF
jgi:hypothetical protein